MSRVLKFRAWDNKQKKMLYGVSIGTIKVWDENAPLISHEFSYSEDCIFEQYTGLTDKNGKEIYEGDLVKCWDGENGEVCFCDISLQYIVKFADGDDEDLASCEAEIIGNIHENPELVGGEE